MSNLNIFHKYLYQNKLDKTFFFIKLCILTFKEDKFENF